MSSEALETKLESSGSESMTEFNDHKESICKRDG
jgi:hypothetical protein